MADRAQRRCSRLAARRRRFDEVTAFLRQITIYLETLNPDPFLMYDGPNGYGYRCIPLNTFYCDNLFPVDDDEPGITIPWPPGEVQVVARLYHLATVEQMPPPQILRVLKRDAWDPRIASWTVETVQRILQDTTYQHIGLCEDDPFRAQPHRWTLVSETISGVKTSYPQIDDPSHTTACEP